MQTRTEEEAGRGRRGLEESREGIGGPEEGAWGGTRRGRAAGAEGARTHLRGPGGDPAENQDGSPRGPEDRSDNFRTTFFKNLKRPLSTILRLYFMF